MGAEFSRQVPPSQAPLPICKRIRSPFDGPYSQPVSEAADAEYRYEIASFRRPELRVRLNVVRPATAWARGDGIKPLRD